MTDDFKLHWQVYFDWYSNEKILADFTNTLKDYLTVDTGNIIDIACGQSPYLIDLLDSKFNLYAIDTEPLQLDYLKKRISAAGHKIERVNFSEKEFPSNDFTSLKFEGIILSNFLHFFTFPEAIDYIIGLEKFMNSGTLIGITVHSSKHKKNKETKKPDDHFKHFFTQEDLYILFPISNYEHLYLVGQQSKFTPYKVSFLNEWIKQVCERFHNIYDPKQIARIQKDYLKDSRTTNFTLLVKRK